MGQAVSLDRKIAQHPNASPATLALLAASKDRATRREVARNAGTSKDVLLALAPAFPSEFLLNPAFDLLLLEDPQLLARLPVTAVKTILSQPDCPEVILRWAARYGGRSLHLALVGRVSISRSLLQSVADSPHGNVAERAGDRLMRGDCDPDREKLYGERDGIRIR